MYKTSAQAAQQGSCVLYVQIYYEAKSVNTQLTYRHTQLKKTKETLEAAWTEHKRLHEAAGLDISEIDSSPSRTCDIPSSSDYQFACVGELSFRGSVFPLRSNKTDNAGTTSVTRCPTSSRVCAADDDLQSWTSTDRPPSVAVRQGQMSSRRQDLGTAGCQPPSSTEFPSCDYDRQAVEQTCYTPAGDNQQLTSSPASTTSSSPVFYCVDDMCEYPAVVEPTSTIVDVDQCSVEQSPLHANDDDDVLESLFGADDWWSTDQSWRWQCGSPVSVVDQASRAENRSAKSGDCSLTTSKNDLPDLLMGLNNVVSGSFRHNEGFIPLHVAGLVDDSFNQWTETLDA